jgi:hypothetical protein
MPGYRTCRGRALIVAKMVAWTETHPPRASPVGRLPGPTGLDR